MKGGWEREVCVWCLVPVGKVGCELNYDAVKSGITLEELKPERALLVGLVRTREFR